MQSWAGSYFLWAHWTYYCVIFLYPLLVTGKLVVHVFFEWNLFTSTAFKISPLSLVFHNNISEYEFFFIYPAWNLLGFLICGLILLISSGKFLATIFRSCYASFFLLFSDCSVPMLDFLQCLLSVLASFLYVTSFYLSGLHSNLLPMYPLIHFTNSLQLCPIFLLFFSYRISVLFFRLTKSSFIVLSSQMKILFLCPFEHSKFSCFIVSYNSKIYLLRVSFICLLYWVYGSLCLWLFLTVETLN